MVSVIVGRTGARTNDRADGRSDELTVGWTVGRTEAANTEAIQGVFWRWNFLEQFVLILVRVIGSVEHLGGICRDDFV